MLDSRKVSGNRLDLNFVDKKTHGGGNCTNHLGKNLSRNGLVYVADEDGKQSGDPIFKLSDANHINEDSGHRYYRETSGTICYMLDYAEAEGIGRYLMQIYDIDKIIIDEIREFMFYVQ